MAEDHKSQYGDVPYADRKNHKYPIDTEAHVRAAWSYINMPKNQKGYTSEEVAAIKSRIKAAAKKFGIEIAEDEKKSDSKRFNEIAEYLGVETRAASISDVDFPERIVTIIAAPYEQPAEIVYKNEIWREMFTRSAFQGLVERRTRIPVNREHNPESLVGKVVETYPARDEGLVVDIYCSRTPRGDEALQQASEDILSASVGFQVKNPYMDQILDRRTRTRRIHRAFLDHIAFVGTPAYENARVLALRNETNSGDENLLPNNRPRLDDWMNDPIFQWANSRFAQ